MQLSSILIAALVANGALATPLKQGAKAQDQSTSSSEVSSTGTSTSAADAPTVTPGGGKGSKKHHQSTKPNKSTNPTATTTGSGTEPTGSGTVGKLDSKQQKNADAILKQLKKEDLGGQEDKACWAVFATALQESQIYIYANPTVPESLKLPHDKVGGDEDSVGIFQQRISIYTDLKADMDPAQSASQFVKNLKAVPNWQTLETSDLCQQVQKAAAGNLYADNIAQAKQICSSGGGSTSSAGTGTATGDPAPTQTGHAKKGKKTKANKSKSQTRTQSTDSTSTAAGVPAMPTPTDE